MKSTGIVRRIDELGRIVIPKEVRKTLKIKSGDPIEIFINENTIMLNKYSPLSANVKEIEDLCKTLSQVSEKSVIITDTEKVICLSWGQKEYENAPITKEISKIITEKQSLIINADETKIPIKIFEGDNQDNKSQLFVPIVNNGEPLGLIALIEFKENFTMGGAEIKLLRLASKLLQDKFLL